MTELHICGVYGLEKSVAKARPDLIISITDPGGPDSTSARETLEIFDLPTLHLSFHDVNSTLDGFTAPAVSDAEKVFAAVDEHLPDDYGCLLVHCHAGVSRSPAIALLALAHIAQRKGEISRDDAFSMVHRMGVTAPYASPNSRILRIIERFMPDGGRLISTEVRRFKSLTQTRATVNNIW